MSILIGIALKSLVVAGPALGLLALMTRRSAAERSWVAHIGLLALAVLAVAPIARRSQSTDRDRLRQGWRVTAAAVKSAPLHRHIYGASTPWASLKSCHSIGRIRSILIIS